MLTTHQLRWNTIEYFYLTNLFPLKVNQIYGINMTTNRRTPNNCTVNTNRYKFITYKYRGHN